MQNISYGVKYFFNTQNVTRGLAAVNPYILVGFSQIYREQRLDGSAGHSKDSAMGFDVGFGIEFPMMRNKMYFGFEVDYQYVNFPNENNEIALADSDGQPVDTNLYPRGDVVKVLGLVGVNF
jgi:hypothetical protein